MRRGRISCVPGQRGGYVAAVLMLLGKEQNKAFLGDGEAEPVKEAGLGQWQNMWLGRDVGEP